MRRRLLALALLLVTAAASAQTELTVHAAGSLRGALTEAARAYEAQAAGTRLKLVFGASGLLKERLSGGERSDVFASANMAHPQALADAGMAAPVQRFARNRLCALVAPGVALTSETLVERLLDPALRVGTSTPVADPSGDYTWKMFERIEQSGRPGAFKQLADKALQLTGGPNSPPPPADRNVYGVLVAEGKADVFITYCTNAVVALKEQPALRLVEVPAAINVAADYGVAVLGGAAAEAGRFVAFLLAEPGQQILARHGFARP